MAHGIGHCHCLHTQLGYCQHCDVTYCYNCKREWGVRAYSYLRWPQNTTYTLSAGAQALGSTTNAFNVSTASTEGHTHG